MPNDSGTYPRVIKVKCEQFSRNTSSLVCLNTDSYNPSLNTRIKNKKSDKNSIEFEKKFEIIKEEKSVCSETISSNSELNISEVNIEMSETVDGEPIPVSRSGVVTPMETSDMTNVDKKRPLSPDGDNRGDFRIEEDAMETFILRMKKEKQNCNETDIDKYVYECEQRNDRFCSRKAAEGITDRNKTSNVNTEETPVKKCQSKCPTIVMSAIIEKIIQHEKGLFICGEKGSVWRIKNGKTFLYQSKTLEDIIDFIIFEKEEKCSLICFSRTDAIYFPDIKSRKSQTKRSFLSGIGRVCHFGQAVYFPLKNGEIWKCFLKSVTYQKVLFIKDLIAYSLAVFKCNGDEHFLMSLWNGQLCVISTNNRICRYFFNTLPMHRVSSLTCDIQYSFSDQEVLFIRGSDFKILQAFQVDYTIKIAVINESVAVIVSSNNRVYIYCVQGKQITSDSVIHDFCKDITAVSLFKRTITVGLGKEIFTIQF